MNAQLRKEILQEPHSIAEAQVVFRNHALDLVELGKMRCIDGFVAEDAVDGEVLCGARV